MRVQHPISLGFELVVYHLHGKTVADRLTVWVNVKQYSGLVDFAGELFLLFVKTSSIKFTEIQLRRK